MALEEEVCQSPLGGVGFEVSNGQARPSGSLFLLSEDSDTELSGTSAAHSLWATTLPAVMIMDPEL